MATSRTEGLFAPPRFPSTGVQFEPPSSVQMFWGAVYGDLVDKFGVGWGFHYQMPEAAD